MTLPVFLKVLLTLEFSLKCKFYYKYSKDEIEPLNNVVYKDFPPLIITLRISVKQLENLTLASVFFNYNIKLNLFEHLNSKIPPLFKSIGKLIRG